METKDINAAIANAMTKIKMLGKGEKNTHQNYNFASIDDFLEMCRPICAGEGLHINPNCVSMDTFPVNNKTWATFTFNITMCHSSGQQTEPAGSMVSLPLTGAQTSGAAQSYAVKQYLRGLLLIATGDNDDADFLPQVEGGIETKATPAPAAAPEPKTTTPSPPPPANADVDWSKWVNDQMNQIKDANKIKLLMWSKKTQKQREDLKEADRELSATLGDFYQQKYDEQNTGER